MHLVLVTTLSAAVDWNIHDPDLALTEGQILYSLSFMSSFRLQVFRTRTDEESRLTGPKSFEPDRDQVRY